MITNACFESRRDVVSEPSPDYKLVWVSMAHNLRALPDGRGSVTGASISHHIRSRDREGAVSSARSLCVSLQKSIVPGKCRKAKSLLHLRETSLLPMASLAYSGKKITAVAR